MVKHCLQVMPFCVCVCMLFLFHHLLLLQREKQTAFRGMFPLKTPAMGLCFFSTGVRRGRKSVCRDFSRSGSSEGTAPAALLALEETSVTMATFLGQTPLLGRLLCTKYFDFLVAIS